VKVLLERHLQIFHVARTKVLRHKELDDALNCFGHLKSAIDYRLLDLKGAHWALGKFVVRVLSY
jgi:hypothetical protein